MTNIAAPEGLSEAGTRLWDAISTEFELGEHELALLREAASTADQIALLQSLVETDGPMMESPQGRKVHPAMVECRQQRIVLARLLAALRIPVDEDVDDRGPVRGAPRGAPRGAYKPRSV